MPLQPSKSLVTKSHLTVALFGPSKSGKSLTALSIAKGLSEGQKFAVLDTERNGSLLYANYFDFDVEVAMPDFSTASYLRFIGEADGRYPVLVIDSLSHAWFARGGILDVANRVGTKAGGSPFGGWSVAAPEHNTFLDTLLQTKSHLVVTMRVKTKWEIITNDKGKLQPVEVGQETVQRDGVTYEFDALFSTEDPQKNLVTALGSRLLCSDGHNLLEGYSKERPGEELGRLMLDWLRHRGDRRAILAGELRRRLGPQAELLIPTATAEEMSLVLDSLQ